MKGVKQCHWCIHHNEGKGMWTIHVAGSCQPDETKPASTTVKVKPKVKFNATTTTIEEASDSD